MYLVTSSLKPEKEFHVIAKSHFKAAVKYANEFGYLIDYNVTRDPNSHIGKMYKITNTDQSKRYDYVIVRKVYALK